MGLELAASPASSTKPLSVVIAGVVEGSPAEKAGVLTGDVLSAVDGEEVCLCLCVECVAEKGVIPLISGRCGVESWPVSLAVSHGLSPSLSLSPTPLPPERKMRRGRRTGILVRQKRELRLLPLLLLLPQLLLLVPSLQLCHGWKIARVEITLLVVKSNRTVREALDRGRGATVRAMHEA